MYGDSIITENSSRLEGTIGGLQPISRDAKDNGVAAMLDNRTFYFAIQHGRHTIVFLDIHGLVANHLNTNNNS